ncbi:hypothetical protein DOY81_014449 [Sarcophaga bullata]|nr:hypothetical protein DOY81_014449 [Sarcophaga bullata]
MLINDISNPENFPINDGQQFGFYANSRRSFHNNKGFRKSHSFNR